jgi:RNA polymerase sigma-70 factor (ECF subfamily)
MIHCFFFANKYVDNINISKDLVQEVFIKVWEDKIEFKNKNNIKSYLKPLIKINLFFI